MFCDLQDVSVVNKGTEVPVSDMRVVVVVVGVVVVGAVVVGVVVLVGLLVVAAVVGALVVVNCFVAVVGRESSLASATALEKIIIYTELLSPSKTCVSNKYVGNRNYESNDHQGLPIDKSLLL